MRARAVGLRVIPPAIAQVRPIILDRSFGMDVAVDDLQLGLGAAVDFLAGFDVHGASSSETLIVARIERQRNPGAALKPCPVPGFAEPVIGPATSGRTRWLNPGYTVI